MEILNATHFCPYFSFILCSVLSCLFCFVRYLLGSVAGYQETGRGRRRFRAAIPECARPEFGQRAFRTEGASRKWKIHDNFLRRSASAASPSPEVPLAFTFCYFIKINNFPFDTRRPRGVREEGAATKKETQINKFLTNRWASPQKSYVLRPIASRSRITVAFVLYNCCCRFDMKQNKFAKKWILNESESHKCPEERNKWVVFYDWLIVYIITIIFRFPCVSSFVCAPAPVPSTNHQANVRTKPLCVAQWRKKKRCRLFQHSLTP